MGKKAEDVVEEIFEGAGSSDARALQVPLLELWKADRWTAEEIVRAAEEAHKPK
jgi:hypothetical protein